MNGKPYQEGSNYLYRSVRDRCEITEDSAHVFAVTQPVDGVTYRAVFSRAGKSMSGAVLKCTYCEPVEQKT